MMNYSKFIDSIDKEINFIVERGKYYHRYVLYYVILWFIFRDKKLNYSTFPRAQLGSPDGMGECQTPLIKANYNFVVF